MVSERRARSFLTGKTQGQFRAGLAQPTCLGFALDGGRSALESLLQQDRYGSIRQVRDGEIELPITVEVRSGECPGLASPHC
jgi:hypothetical protein